MKTYSGHITSLKENQVFVFGSNMNGFHGAGAAGFASFGVPGNSWRKFNYDKWPYGKKGMWNVKGVPEGFQEGEMGCSYAIPTVIHAGGKRSMRRDEICLGIKKMYEFAMKNPDKEFLVAYTTTSDNLNGYTTTEIASMFAFFDIPDNVVFEEGFASYVEWFILP